MLAGRVGMRRPMPKVSSDYSGWEWQDPTAEVAWIAAARHFWVRRCAARFDGRQSAFFSDTLHAVFHHQHDQCLMEVNPLNGDQDTATGIKTKEK